jgi:hypothetical protein
MVDTVTITTPDTTGDAPAEHNQKMIDKANGVTPPADDGIQAQAERPSWLPEKFKSAEDMAQAYAALETKLGAGTPPAADAAPVVPTDSVVDAELSKGGMSLQEFSTEFDAKGSLSEESYAKLLAGGYDKTIVDNYIAGQQARASLHSTEMKATVGGSEAYDRITTWAKSAMTPSEIDAYNLSVGSTNHDTAKLAMAGLKARYEAANGRDPSLVKGNTGGNTSNDSFASNREITQAMRDPRYKTDSAYRSQVVAKLGRSNFR